MDRILLEFVGTCEGAWGREQQLVVDTIARSKWKDNVDLQFYVGDESSAMVAKYGEFDGPTLVINQRMKLTRLSADRIIKAIEKAVSWGDCI